MNILPEITRKIWRITNPYKFCIEVSLHSEGESYTPEGKGVFCYYIYIPESHYPAKFPELWLEDLLEKWSEVSPVRVSHDYFKLPILDHVDFHCGCTFYDKQGHSIGHRAVKLGCDYNHLYDSENPPHLARVIEDALATAEEIATYLTAE